MSRLRRLEDRDRIFFVTSNIARTQTPLVPIERDLVLETLATQRAAGRLLLFAYVVMPDHVHLLLAARELGLAAAMRDFKQLVTHRLAQDSKRSGPLLQPRYFDRILRAARDFTEKLDYIHNNPVAAGLCAAPTAWRWSSAAAYAKSLDGCEAPLPVDTIDLPCDSKAWLRP